MLGVEVAIHDREARMMAFWLNRWREVPGIELLGTPAAGVGIVSFLLRFGDLYLHPNFVLLQHAAFRKLSSTGTAEQM